MAQIGPIEVVVTTSSDIDRALAKRDGWILRFALGAVAVGAVLGWLATWLYFRA